MSSADEPRRVISRVARTMLNPCAMQAVVLAGGLATRMRPQTLAIPKAMLAVAGRPFVDWQLERLAQCGLRDVVLCIAFLGEQIRAHVGDGARHGVRVTWSEEGGKL